MPWGLKSLVEGAVIIGASGDSSGHSHIAFAVFCVLFGVLRTSTVGLSTLQNSYAGSRSKWQHLNSQSQPIPCAGYYRRFHQNESLAAKALSQTPDTGMAR
jgi:hypothetical protein